MKIILSIDGGGIRGIVSAAILNYLEKKIQEIQGNPRIKIGSLVDLVAGTSSGSIIGSMMLLPCDDKKPIPRYFMQEIIDLYVDMGQKVFKKTLGYNLKTLWGLFGSRYSASNIEDFLLQSVGHYKLQDLIKPCLFTGYDIEKRKANIYTNKDKDEEYGHYYVKDIIKGSASIPGYFPPAYFRDGIDIHTIVDGGVFVNNPAMIAYIEAFKTLFNLEEGIKDINLHKVMVISIGTGKFKNKNFSYNKIKRWGRAKWFFSILDIIVSGTSDIVDYEMKKLFKVFGRSDNYKRIDPPLYLSSFSMTDASKENITNLLKDVSVYINENKMFLNILAREICDLNYLIKY